MTTFTQGIETLEFMLSPPRGMRHLGTGTVTVAGSVALPSGTVLGKVTATGKFIKQTDGAGDGSQAAAAILVNPRDGVNGDYNSTLVLRDCEVIGDRLNGGAGPSALAKAALLALGIVVR